MDVCTDDGSGLLTGTGLLTGDDLAMGEGLLRSSFFSIIPLDFNDVVVVGDADPRDNKDLVLSDSLSSRLCFRHRSQSLKSPSSNKHRNTIAQLQNATI